MAPKKMGLLGINKSSLTKVITHPKYPDPLKSAYFAKTRPLRFAGETTLRLEGPMILQSTFGESQVPMVGLTVWPKPVKLLWWTIKPMFVNTSTPDFRLVVEIRTNQSM